MPTLPKREGTEFQTYYGTASVLILLTFPLREGRHLCRGGFMPIFSNNPVWEREVRGRLRLRRKGSLAANLWIARILGVVVAFYYAKGLLGVWRGTLQDARELWPLLVYGTLTLIVLLAPALSATAITTEREQQTWEILATTRLSASEVLLGKWLGRQLVPWLLVAILLPYMMMCAVRGQMGFFLLPSVLAFLLLTTGCYSALGLLCSFQTRRTMTATASALTVSALLCLGTIIVNQVYSFLVSQRFGSGTSLVLWANPFYALDSLLAQLGPDRPGFGAATDPLAAFFYLLFTALTTAAALRFMVARYRSAVRG